MRERNERVRGELREREPLLRMFPVFVLAFSCLLTNRTSPDGFRNLVLTGLSCLITTSPLGGALILTALALAGCKSRSALWDT